MNASGEDMHGGIDYREMRTLGLNPNDIIDFSSNILPYGPSPEVIRSLHDAAIERYPDREGYTLRAELAKHHGMTMEQILLGNGCSELIHLVATTWIGPRTKVMVFGPTFTEYSRASKIAGALRVETITRSFEKTANDMDVLDKAILHQCPDVVWICNPNNPTGHCLDSNKLATLIACHPNVNFVVDESYLDFEENSHSLIASVSNNLIVLRSMTKYYAIAGLRLGYLSCSEETMTRLKVRRVPWSVNDAAMVAGVAALNSRDYYRKALQCLRDAKIQLFQDLQQVGLKPMTSTVPYFLLPVENGRQVRDALLRDRILVRDCSSFGLENWIRIATQAQEDNAKLVESMRRLLPR